MEKVAVFADEEKASIRHHLGYPNVSQISTFALGVGAGVETNFVIERAMEQVTEKGAALVRRLLAVLDKIECQMIEDMENMAVSSIGEITVDPKEQAKLKREYLYWGDALANAIGAVRNPFDLRFNPRTTEGGINVSVQN